MRSFRFFLLSALTVLVIVPAQAQFGRGVKVVLKRSLPPAVALDAKSFNITATAQEAAAQQVAASFQELFKAKIQNDDRFIYNDSNPELRISIVLTRFYVEAKTIPYNKTTCVTNLGNLQGTFRVIESDTGRPVASDTLSWKLTTNDTSHILVSDDGAGLPVKGPGHHFSTVDMRENIEKSGILSGINPFSKNHPCQVPFSVNEARDVLADIFLTEMLHLSTPYTINAEVKVSGDKLFRNAVEEMVDKQQWAKARDLLEAIPAQPRASDEAAHLHLIAVAYEGMGYGKGEEVVAASKQIKRGMSEAQLTPLRANLRRVEDEAKGYFEKAALNFRKANEKSEDDEYRSGERRAEESRRLYVRIQNYREAKPVEVTTDAGNAALSMAEVISMCQQGSSALIIVDRIETAKTLSVTREQFGELAKCNEKQDALFSAIKKRLDAKK